MIKLPQNERFLANKRRGEHYVFYARKKRQISAVASVKAMKTLKTALSLALKAQRQANLALVQVVENL